MQTELRPVEGYLENVLDFLQHSDIIRSCLIELNMSEKKNVASILQTKASYFFTFTSKKLDRDGDDLNRASLSKIQKRYRRSLTI